jgi:predicted NBD/HSP70 family sugar kinase
MRTLADQDDLRAHNLQAVAHFVRGRSESSRGEIGDALALNKATVSSLVGELIGRGILEEGGSKPAAGRGRPQSIVRMDNSVHASIVVELLADTVRLGAWTLGGQGLALRELPIRPAERGPRSTLSRLSRAVGELIGQSSDRRIAGILVAVPGLLDLHTGRVLRSAPLGWRNVEVRLDRIGHPVLLGRIANLATVAEWRHTDRVGDLLCVHGSDTGLGMGIVVRGELLVGGHGRAGELLFPRSTGDFGRLEQLLGRARDIDDFVRRLNSGQRGALTAINGLVTGIADRLATLVALLDPESVVLAGYLAALGDHLVIPLRRELAARLAFREQPDVPLTPGHYGTEAAQIGGAALLADSVLERLRRRA